MGKQKFFEDKRKQLVEFMEINGSVKTESVKNAFLKIEREKFMREGNEEAAYIDSAFSIGCNQTISQPSTIAIMLEMLSVPRGAKLLEIGAGCGYVLALLSELVGKEGKIYGVELIPELKEIAEKNLKKINIKNVELQNSDGTLGLPEHAPFDRILVSAACGYLPKPLFDQLSEDGIAVAPIGDAYSQTMTRIRKKKGKILRDEYLGTQFVFVPLRGEFGV